VTGLFAGAGAALLLAAGPAASSPSPPPILPADLLPTPTPLPLPSLPLPSLPPILPGPSPSPTSAGGSTGTGSQSSGGQAATQGGQLFSSSGIAGAFAPTAARGASTARTAASPGPAQAAAPPASIFSPSQIFPQDPSAVAQSAVLPLLMGLLLLSLGLWLMAMRHRREALVAASLERTKTDFLNLASHELRGPLTVLKGHLATAEEGAYGELPSEFAGRLPVVQKQLARMEMLVEQMLETARLDAGHPDVRREPADLRGLIQDSLPTEMLEGGDDVVRVEAPAEPVVADVDQARIEQVLHHLIENALKYSDPPAEVLVRLTAEGGAARIDVMDRGHGIAPENMDRLFSRFGRLVTEENSHVPGVGLGLFLGRAVARMHGGDLTAVSTPGEGSTFTLTLPLQGAPPRPIPTQRGRGGLVRWFGRLLPSRGRGSAS
jgi:signal transduction histidine kinase